MARANEIEVYPLNIAKRQAPEPPSQEPPRKDWHGTPLTIGLLVTLVLAVVWGIDQWVSHEERLRVERQRMINAHNRDDHAHPGIRQQLTAMEKRMADRVHGVSGRVESVSRRVDGVARDVRTINHNVDRLRTDIRRMLIRSRRQ